jgi:hypothetical protein
MSPNMATLTLKNVGGKGQFDVFSIYGYFPFDDHDVTISLLRVSARIIISFESASSPLEPNKMMPSH